MTIVDNGASPPEAPHKSLLARHSLVFYFLIAFAFSWLLFLPGVLTYYGVLNAGPQIVGLLGIAGLLGPLLSGFIMTALSEGRPGVRLWLRRIVLWRVGLRWYLFALFGLPVVMVLGTLVRTGALASFQTLAPLSVVPYISAFVFMVFIGGPLFEEPGWSGFAQLRLQQLHGPLAGGLILGSLWAFWHLPGFLIPSEELADIPPRGTVLDFVVFALALIALRLIIQWVFNNTKGSVLMAILVHASWNTFYSAALIQLFPAPSVLGSYLNLAIAAGALAMVILVVTRGCLGYRHYQQGEEPDSATAAT
ncbi:MAG: CPBP family intramembrane metalloprotease [Rubrobacter sp.]|nr:CPBP family intramembrane metalloprotease [Rubrobacter sp.]